MKILASLLSKLGKFEIRLAKPQPHQGFIMKKMILLLTLSLLSSSVLACAYELEKQISAPSDHRLKIKWEKRLSKNEEISNYRDDLLFINPYDEVDFYKATGSYHSGWFQLGLIVDRKNCELLNEFVMASE